MATEHNVTQLRYRPEIDGLRAVSVVAVMLYHGGFAAFGGGYVGVDVFFVISGYLITGIIARGLVDGTFAWSDFAKRRIRRLLPALCVVLAVSTAVAWAFLPPAGLKGFSASLTATAVAGANLYFLQEAGGYFATHATMMPLLHLWSFSLEEQFYFLYPPTLLILSRLGTRRLILAIALTAGISLAIAAIGAQIAPVATFYLLPGRVWEFAGGALIALHELHRGRAARTPVADLAALVGLGLILFAVLGLDERAGFPWPTALTVVAGSTLILGYATAGSPVALVLASRPLVACGLISYSAYLWHQPLLAFARNLSPYALTTGATVLLLAAALGLAALTWRYVEQPLRTSRVGDRRGIWWVTAATLSVFAIIGCVGFFLRGAPQRFDADRLSLMTMREAHARSAEPCMSPVDATTLLAAPCLRGRSGRVTMAIVGDSHAAAMVPAVAALADRRGVRALELTNAGCPTVFDPLATRPFQTACVTFNRAAYDRITSDRDIDTVVILSRWTYNLLRTLTDNGEGGVEDSKLEAPATPPEQARTGRAYQAFVRAYLDAGKRVILVYPDVEPGWDVPMMMLRGGQWGYPDIDTSVSQAWVRARNAPASRVLDAIRHPDIVRVYPERALCGRERPGRCITRIGGRPLYYDDDHVTPEAARMIFAPLLR